MTTGRNLYAKALKDIDASDKEVADGFEIQFLVSNLRRVAHYGDATTFTGPQQRVIQELTLRYLGPEREAELRGQLRLEGL